MKSLLSSRIGGIACDDKFIICEDENKKKKEIFNVMKSTAGLQMCIVDDISTLQLCVRNEAKQFIELCNLVTTLTQICHLQHSQFRL